MKFVCLLFFHHQMSTIKLQSSDGEIFKVNFEAVKCSGTIKAMLEDCDDDEEVMALPNVHSTILCEILKWSDHHKDDIVPSDDDDAPTDDDGNYKGRTELPPWDANFLKVEQGRHFIFEFPKFFFFGH